LRNVNERIFSGKPGYTSSWALGVPEFLPSPVQPLYFLQTLKEVVMIQQMGQQVRHIYLNIPYSARVTTSWCGESAGHCVGDTLVVDTFGLNNSTWIDNCRTPRTAQLHVVERFHRIDGGKGLEVNVHVEDPGTFTSRGIRFNVSTASNSARCWRRPARRTISMSAIWSRWPRPSDPTSDINFARRSLADTNGVTRCRDSLRYA
jgi:hypothetical protein